MVEVDLALTTRLANIEARTLVFEVGSMPERKVEA